MISNPVPQADPPAVQPPTSLATPSILPPKWNPPFNISYNQFGGPGIPLDSLNEKPEKDRRTKDKKKNRKKKRRKGKKDRVLLGPLPVVSPGTREAAYVHAISSA